MGRPYSSIGRGYLVKGETIWETKSRIWDIVKCLCAVCRSGHVQGDRGASKIPSQVERTELDLAEGILGCAFCRMSGMMPFVQLSALM